MIAAKQFVSLSCSAKLVKLNKLHLQVTSGGPILGVSKEASKSSGSLSYAAAPLIALSGLAVMAVGVMA